MAQPKPVAAFDPRLLLKLEVRGIQPDLLQHVEGFEVVSHEGNELVVLFASEQGLREFKRRLGCVKRGEKVTRKEIIFAIERFDVWSPDDRRGSALAAEGLPDEAEVVVDVELWPLERSDQRERMSEAFEVWCKEQRFIVVDNFHRPSLVLYRLAVPRLAVEDVLLRHRDVRTVDLPPRYYLDTSCFDLRAQDLPEIPPTPEAAPSVVVLDTGITANHPLLAPAVGDAQSFVDGLEAADRHGHGTAVAGFALYGDVARRAAEKNFVPELRILSGKLFGDDGHNRKLLQNVIVEAVDYFVDNYGARIFNLSMGDERKPFVGGHVRGLAVTLDELSRTRNVLFVVSAGNYKGEEQPPRWRSDYPNYLLERREARILEPAPALNVLTVGGLARYERSHKAQRDPRDPAVACVARKDQPSPFTRAGPGACGAIKPELVEYAGNYAVDHRNDGETKKHDGLLGEIALNHEFVTHGLFTDRLGTSFAAPKVAHLAAKLLRDYPDASPNLLRALLVASAEVPDAAHELQLDEHSLRRLVGYGRPNEHAALYSTERRVTLVNETAIEPDTHHFYEVPLPEDFLARGVRERYITVGIAHCPVVRTTRFDYRASKLGFHLVAGTDLTEITHVFRRSKKTERIEMLPELRKGNVGKNARDRGTVQAARYAFRLITDDLRTKKLFVVVTHQVPAWAQTLVDREPYAIVVSLEDRSGNDVRLYTQVELLVRQRARQRA